MSDLSYSFDAANKEYNLLLRAGYVLGVEKAVFGILDQIEKVAGHHLMHEDWMRAADSVLDLSAADKQYVHGVIDGLYEDQAQVSLHGLRDEPVLFSKAAVALFDGFSEGLSCEQQAYGALHVAESLLKTMDVGYKPRIVHDVEDYLDGLTEPSDQDLKTIEFESVFGL